MFNVFLKLFLIAFSYFLTALISQWELLIPNYAAVIWPPAGIALASLLILGLQQWPGVFFGAMAANLFRIGGILSGDWLTIDILTQSALISTGSTLSAVLGAYLIQRFIGLQNLFVSGRNITWLLLLGGPVSCLISAIIGSLTLLMSGIIIQDSLLFNLFTWWLGDSIGVLVMTPLLIIWSPGLPKEWYSLRFTLSGGMFLVLLLVALLLANVNKLEHQRAKAMINQQASRLTEDFRSTFQVIEELLYSMANFIQLTPQIDDKIFADFTRPLLERHEGIQALEWIPRVLEKDRFALEQRVRRWYPNFQIQEKDHNANLVLAAKRSLYFPVALVEPMDGNEKVMGFDLGSNSARLSTLNTARDTARAAVSGRIDLLQDRDEKAGILMLVPIYQSITPPASLKARQTTLMGYALGVLRIKTLITTTLARQIGPILPFQIIEMNSSSMNQLLYQTPNAPMTRHDDLLQTFQVADRIWQIHFYTKNAPEYQNASLRAWLTPVAGLLFAALMEAFILLIISRDLLTRNLVKQRTADLEEANALLTELINTSPSGIVIIEQNGLVALFNPSAERIFGFTSDEIIGQHVKTFLPMVVNSNQADFIQHYLTTGDQSTLVMEQEMSASHKDGYFFPIHIAVGVMKTGMTVRLVTIITDITARKKAEEDLRQKHRAVEVSPVGVIITNTQGIIEYINPASLNIHGYQSAVDLQGLKISIFKSGETPIIIYQEMWQHLQVGQSWSGELCNKRKDGSLVWVKQHLCSIQNEQGLIERYVTIQEDVTEVRKYQENLEETVKKRTVELEKAKDAAEAGARTKAAFVANMSHEIRTPINAVIGFAEVVLKAPELASVTHQQVRTILNSAKALLGIINDILDVSKLESGRFSLESVCFHLKNSLIDGLRTVEHRASEKGLTLHIIYDDALSLQVMGDPTRLRQVILNLVGNAIKFTEQGGVTIRVQRGEQPDSIHFTVIDTGIGMTAEQLNSIFDPFSQADASTTRRFGGTGLGTTISKEIVEMMGGKIWAVSEIGAGSELHFTAILPAVNSEESCLYDQEIFDNDEYISPRLFRVLLAEDIEANAELAMLRLKEQGHEVVWARNGQETVEMYQQGGFEIILMDVMMPILDGLGATHAIRVIEDNTNEHIVILALTASIMQEDSEKYLKAGMDAVESKPINFNHLFAEMERLVPDGLGGSGHRITPQIKPLDLDFSPLEGVVDHIKALKTWKDASAYLKALMTFVETRGNDAETLHRLLEEHSDHDTAALEVIHTLKGVAGNLAMDQLAHLAATIETDLKSSHRVSAQSRVAELHHSLTEMTGRIGQLTLSKDRHSIHTHPFDLVAVTEILNNLYDAMESLNPDVIDPVIEKLAHYLTKSDCALIEKCVDAFDFDKAKINIINLAKKLKIRLN